MKQKRPSPNVSKKSRPKTFQKHQTFQNLIKNNTTLSTIKLIKLTAATQIAPKIFLLISYSYIEKEIFFTKIKTLKKLTNIFKNIIFTIS